MLVVIVHYRVCKTNLYRILCGYVGHYVLQSVPCCVTEPLPPHVLVQITRELMLVAASHPLELRLHPRPVTLNVLGVNPCSRLDEVKGVIHYPMRRNSGQSMNLSIGCPLIGVNNCSRCSVGLNNW